MIVAGALVSALTVGLVALGAVPQLPRAAAAGPQVQAGMAVMAAGAPEAPVQVWTEGFENNLGNSASRLGDYRTSAGGAFTGSTYWFTYANCNGVIANYSANLPVPNGAGGSFPAGLCTAAATAEDGVAQLNVRRLADVLGQVAAGTAGGATAATAVNGSTTATRANHAVAEWTLGVSGTANQIVLESPAGLGATPTASRYYTATLDVAEASCGTALGLNNSRFDLFAVAGGTERKLTATPLQVCTDAAAAFYTSTLPANANDWGAPGNAVRGGRLAADTAVLLTPAQISGGTFRVRNQVATANGDNAAIDNPRLLDVTPSLDTAFSPTSVPAGDPTTMTFTITNTSELAAKPDWGFVETLPAGITVAPTPAVGGTCTNTSGTTAFTVTAAAGSSTITAAGGDLAAGSPSCTVTVAVTASAVGTYTATAANLTTVLNPPDPTTLTVTQPATITVRKNITARTAPTDQFTVSLRSGTAVLASATTTGTTTGIQAAQVSNYIVQPGSTYTIHEAPTSGSGLGYSNGYECVRGGTVIASGSSASGSVTVPNEPGVSVVCTFTNTPQPVRLFCDTNHFYSMTAAGAMLQADIVSGTSTAVGTWAGTDSANALGVASGGTAAYAIERSADATDVDAVLKWTPGGGFQTIAGSAYTTVAGTTQIAGSIVAGAVDLTNNRYLFGKFANSQFYIWSYTESNPVATRFAYVGSFATGTAPNGNGDMAFDARGNLYVLGAAVVNNQNSAAIFTVTAETLAAASGGTLAVNASTTRALAGTEATPAFTNVNGIAFSPRGTAYLANAGSAYEFDPTTWTRVAGTPRVVVDSVDLAGCSSPSTVAVQKNVVGRIAAADQFQLTLSTGAPVTTIATTTTSGAATGRQAQQIGPVPAPVGTTLSFSEAMATGSASALTAYTVFYECWSDGVRVSNGTASSGTVTVPDRLSAAVTCTLFNSPRPASTVRITKLLQQASGVDAPVAGWTVGVTATATVGTATVLPSEAPQQQTDGSGQASWAVLFGSTASRATLAISEVQRPGSAFVSGSCTVNGAARAVTFTQSGGVVTGSLTGIASASTIDCTIVNRPTALLTLVKSVAYGSAFPTAWVLTATAPAGALPGPSGVTNTAQTTSVPVTPDVAYRLSESGGPLTYVQTGTWQCVTATGDVVPVTPAGDVTPPASAAVTCTVTNATASVTLLKHVLDPQPGFTAPRWTLTATPAALAAGQLPTETRLGAEYSAAGNAASTFEVRPGHAYTLAERATDPGSRLAYRQVGIERLEGSTWVAVASSTITAPAAGQTSIYRLVNTSVVPTVLPLTGGPSADLYRIVGSAVVAVAALLALAHAHRLRRRRL